MTDNEQAQETKQAWPALTLWRVWVADPLAEDGLDYDEIEAADWHVTPAGALVLTIAGRPVHGYNANHWLEIEPAPEDDEPEVELKPDLSFNL